jgi:hypothetical protein
MNKDFQEFSSKIHSFNRKNNQVEFFKISNEFLSNKFMTTFPTTSKLLERSRKVGFELNDQTYFLFSWNGKNGFICNWLCLLNNGLNNMNLIEEHEILIQSIGGIREYIHKTG